MTLTTHFEFFFLFSLTVPVSRVIIRDQNGTQLDNVAGPYNEDTAVNITCEAEGGNDTTYV